MIASVLMCCLKKANFIVADKAYDNRVSRYAQRKIWPS